jgi:predicted RNase H-like HicB family nuclease
MGWKDGAMAKKYTVSDGKIVLSLEEAAEGGFIVSSPLDPGVWTQAESVGEAFENARDAMKELAAARRQLAASAKTVRRKPRKAVA